MIFPKAGCDCEDAEIQGPAEMAKPKIRAAAAANDAILYMTLSSSYAAKLLSLAPKNCDADHIQGKNLVLAHEVRGVRGDNRVDKMTNIFYPGTSAAERAGAAAIAEGIAVMGEAKRVSVSWRRAWVGRAGWRPVHYHITVSGAALA